MCESLQQTPDLTFPPTLNRKLMYRLLNGQSWPPENEQKEIRQIKRQAKCKT